VEEDAATHEMSAARTLREEVDMADHLDAPGLKSPHMDAAIDITDHYIFQKPGDPNKSILIANVNPLAPTLATDFDSTAVHELKVDTNGDAVAEIAFRITFSPVQNGVQKANVRRATGTDAAAASGGGDLIIADAPVSYGNSVQVSTAGDYKFFAGIRSDPFFFDLMGFLNGLKFTGSDFFADKNVFSMALEVPNTALGSNPKIGVWFRTLMPDSSGTLTQIDRMGRPAINTVFNHGDDKNTFNTIEPMQDRALFLDKFVAVLKSFGYAADQATGIAQILLPDILTYDYTSADGFLNGRKLTDDVIDIELGLVTNKQITTDKVGPHTDLLGVFPYVGNPHPTGVPLSATPYEPHHHHRPGHPGASHPEHAASTR
jgi:hypothetical protein